MSCTYNRCTLCTLAHTTAVHYNDPFSQLHGSMESWGWDLACWQALRDASRDRGAFLERPRNFSVPKANFKINICWIVTKFLAYKSGNLLRLLVVSLNHFQNYWSFDLELQIRQTYNNFAGPKNYRDLRETGPRVLRTSVVAAMFAAIGKASYCMRLSLEMLTINCT